MEGVFLLTFEKKDGCKRAEKLFNEKQLYVFILGLVEGTAKKRPLEVESQSKCSALPNED